MKMSTPGHRASLSRPVRAAVYPLLLLIGSLIQFQASAQDRVAVGGSVLFGNTPICALVLINGQSQFSCDGTGSYDMEVPLDGNGLATVQAFADGFAPFREVLTPQQAADYAIDLFREENGRSLNVESLVSDSQQVNRVTISGTVEVGESPVCALALANGQKMFTCGDQLGTFGLDVPLDENGEITLMSFAFGFKPYRAKIVPVNYMEPYLVSVDSSGEAGNERASSFTSISSHGRYVAFASLASDLVDGDTNDQFDIFVRDGILGVTSRVSVDSSGAEALFDGSLFPSISADGRYVAFDSDAGNLVDVDTNGTDDVFVHDRQTGITTLISKSSTGIQGNSYSQYPSISSDGRFVAYSSEASNLVANDSGGQQDAFVHDRNTGTTTRVSVSSAGVAANDGAWDVSISKDGRFVSFSSEATNLVAQDDPGLDVFVHERESGTTSLVTTESFKEEFDMYAGSYAPSMSGDGRFVAFVSGNVTGEEGDISQVFVHDRNTGATRQVSVDSQGSAGNDHSNFPSVSANGRYIAFCSDATNLVPNDTNETEDVFVHDLDIGNTIRVSVDADGVEGDGRSRNPMISADGRQVTFTTDASNLVEGDSNGVSDVVVTTIQWQ